MHQSRTPSQVVTRSLDLAQNQSAIIFPFGFQQALARFPLTKAELFLKEDACAKISTQKVHRSGRFVVWRESQFGAQSVDGLLDSFTKIGRLQ